jgi:phage shock protein C
MTEDPPRRIYRSREDRVIAGVAGGIARHLGVDPVLVRISFVALAFSGIGFLLYLIAWIVISEAPAGIEPLASTGTPGANSARIVVGTVLVAIGVLLLLDIVLPIRRVIWPGALIVVGIAVFAYGTRR